MKKNVLLMAFAGLFAAATFGACSKDEDSSSPLVGTWQSVGYYDNNVNGNYYQGITTAPLPDASEKITFKSNGKGVYTANGSEKEFEWREFDDGIAVYISTAPDIHNDDNWDYGEREYDVSSTELAIIWSNKAQYVYRKI